MEIKLKSFAAIIAIYLLGINICLAQTENLIGQSADTLVNSEEVTSKSGDEASQPKLANDLQPQSVSELEEPSLATEEPAPVKESHAAKQVVEVFQAQLLETMKQGDELGFEGRYKKLAEPVLVSHDLSKIARIVLGKEWKKLTIEQKQNMVDLFTRLSIASYAYNFKGFSGEAFKFESEEETSRGGMIVHTSLILPDDKDVKFDYMLKSKGESWLIINIIANGVSDLALKRSEYTSILKREGFDALLAKISGKIEKYSLQ
jgi:phospholipid transport system substrate-binding protein